ncbi:MAG: vitamin B12 dependent-methionine synthase activation domain-containing protein, partial [Woeseia sp.]
IYVKDASRSVGIAQALVEQGSRDELVQKVRDDNAKRRERHAGNRRQAPQLSLNAARENRFRGDWQAYQPPVPTFTGTQVLEDIDLKTLADFIDWMPFFNAWEFFGKFPAILSDAVRGEAASALYADARIMLQRIIDERWLTARAVVGFFPANTIDHDDIQLYRNAQQDPFMRLCQLRQQKTKPRGKPNDCLADFVAPVDSGLLDHLGAFAVTAGIGIDEHVQRFEAEHDDYSSIILKALADRLAEAGAEYLHQRVRREWWAYAPDEALRNEELIAEKYRGIRPAPGYPACPDHTEKAKLWQLLDVEKSIGLRLTESFAMYPTAAVSGFYFSHPESRYFAVGQIDRDQVESVAQRKGWDVAEVERWLAPNLGYEPSKADAA